MSYELIFCSIGDMQTGEPTMAEYMAPTSDNPAVFYVPKSAVKKLTKFEVTCLMLHETEPGHHF